MRRRFPLLTAVSVLTAVAAIGSPPATAEKAPAVASQKLEAAECGSIARLHRLGDIFLASQPAAADLTKLKQCGVKAVVNLRPAAENTEFDERQLVEAEGLSYLNLPIGSPADLTDEVFDAVRKQLATAGQPILVHCASANRVGAVWLPYRVLDGGLGYEEALAEATTVGLKSAELEAKARAYIERHRSGSTEAASGDTKGDGK